MGGLFDFSSQKSKTTPGYYDPRTQDYRDYFSNMLFGSPMGETSTPTTTTYSPAASPSPTTGQGFGRYQSRSPVATTASGSGKTSYSGPQSFTGGLFGEMADTSAKTFGGDYSYKPSSYSSSVYNPYEFKTPSLTETKVDPSMWKNYSDTISKGGRQNAFSTIQKAQEEAAYQGRGGGDLADYRAKDTLRQNANAIADAMRGLSSERMQQEFKDTADVKRQNQQAEMWKQGQQSGANIDAAKFGEASKQFGASFGEQSKQFGDTQKMEYLKNKLSEVTGNKQNLNQLMQILNQFMTSGQEGPTSTAKGFSMKGGYE